MFIPNLIHSLINTLPGSEMLGVPASDISEIEFPEISKFLIFSKFFFH